MPVKPNRVGSATRATGGPAADGDGLMPSNQTGLGLQLDSLALPQPKPYPNSPPIKGLSIR
jgi:hypothetical protein